MPYSRTLLISLCLLAASMPAAAQGDAERVSLFSEISFDNEPETAKQASAEPYGSKDTRFYMLGTTLAPDFTGNVDASIHGQYTYFLIDDFEVGVEAAFWGFFQENNTVGLSSSLVMRYHFYQARRWSAFAELGIGVLIATDNVPDDGTNFNLMPRAGAGITYQLFEDRNTRLITGLRWHHISNARLAGEERNPARDAPGLYVGLLYEF
ncbi:MAG: acyloxyacyl hydrolase [Phycisphaera sp.]|nr:MAG: acyloxyacyl hydrolase [Phycisphaera sp.]